MCTCLELAVVVISEQNIEQLAVQLFTVVEGVRVWGCEGEDGM